MARGDARRSVADVLNQIFHPTQDAVQVVALDAGGTAPPAAAALSDAFANPTATQVGAFCMFWDGSNWQRARIVSTNADANAGGVGLRSVSFPFGYTGGNSYDRLRTPNVFKVVALGAATAETTIWTPTSGKKFRLMGFLLTCGAASTLTFKDNTSGTTIFAARAATDTPISPQGLGNGILSGAADRVLTVTRGTSATLDGAVWGTEE